jgi:hypothetical protein
MTALSSLGITDGTNNPPSEAVPEAKISSKEASLASPLVLTYFIYLD